MTTVSWFAVTLVPINARVTRSETLRI